VAVDETLAFEDLCESFEFEVAAIGQRRSDEATKRRRGMRSA
jgi:hypothetical protein